MSDENSGFAKISVASRKLRLGTRHFGSDRLSGVGYNRVKNHLAKSRRSLGFSIASSVIFKGVLF